MTLKERINQDLIAAMRAREKEKSLVLRGLNSAIKNAEIVKRTKISKAAENSDLEKNSVLSDEEVVVVLSSQIKQRRDSIAEFEKANRTDLVLKEKTELEILSAYMPEQMSEEDVRKLVSEAIAKTGAKESKEMGKVMAVLMPQVKGKADGTMVSGIVKELLSK